MINIDLQQLVQALDPATRQDLETAAQRCVTRSGTQVLVEDLMLCLLERTDSLLNRALSDAELAPGDLAEALQPRREDSASRNPAFSLELVQWLQNALLVANLELGRTQVDQAALILALLRDPSRYAGSHLYPFLTALNAERLLGFARDTRAQTQSAQSSAGPASALESFTHNLTQRAREGKLDPVLCRDVAIRQMVDILARRRKNNPIVVGEAGVGKTAIVEGLALRIVAGQVPQTLQGVELRCLDLGLLQAGASIKGEFEKRLQGVINEVKASVTPIILFIDEAHTLIGAGGQAGGGDAANLLKPALARGELRTIAATTWSEFKRYFEKDPALARRFQPVQLQEPTVDEAVTILRGLTCGYEKSHGVYVRDDAVVAAAKLSARYITGRQLPDKAVDVLDTACARVRISLSAAPEKLDTLRNQIAEQERQQQALLRDYQSGLAVETAMLDELETTLVQARAEEQGLQDRWDLQRRLAEKLLEIRGLCAEARLDGTKAKATLEELQGQLKATQRELHQAQAEERLVSHEVCPRLIAEVISHWTGIPLSQLAREHNASVARFAENLGARLLGQDQAIEALDRAMRATAAGLNRRDAPVGVFLLVGPSGVGKTETALALADLLYGGERFLTTINMSEFQEKHSVSRLIGAPPGYVGFGEGGMLTEAVRQKPYSVVLLDEVEKSDPDVMNVFYQIFDKGIANDGEGREINFRNTLILMTSNLASEQILSLCHNGQRPPAEQLEQAIQPTLSRHFKPALLARMHVVPYYPVANGVMRELITLKLARFAQRLHDRDVEFTHCHALVEHFADRCIQGETGARLIDRLIDQQLQPLAVDRLLSAIASGERVERAHATLNGEGVVTCEFA